MNVDTYTKAVLTVIAACLVWMCAKDADFIPSAHAQEEAAARPPIKVEVVNHEERAVKVEIVEAGDDFDEYVPVIIRGVDFDGDDAEGYVPVRIDEVKANIQNALPVSGQ